MALDVPASPSGANPPADGGVHEGYGLARPVADASPMAAEAAGFTAREARGHKVTRVVSPTISVRQRLREIWLSRELLVYLVRTEIKVKYKNSVLGLVWSMIAPAMTLAIYFIVFQVVLGNRMPNFVIFLFAGLLMWNLFSARGAHRHRSDRQQRRHRQEGVVPPRDPGAGRRGLGLRLLLLPVLRDGHLPDRPAQRARTGPTCRCSCWRWSPASCWPAPSPSCSRRSTCTYATRSTSLRSSSRPGSGPARSSTPSSRTSRSSWAPRASLWVYFLNPVTPLVLTFQRCLYGKVSPTAPGQAAERKVAWSRRISCCRMHGYLWYLALDLGVLALAVVLFLVALAVFGRLEGNFAEEL